MNPSAAPVRNVSDTARWVAFFRAKETQRPDALFRDPYAERLAGEDGFQIANTLQDGNKHEWAWVARTYLFDQFLSRAIASGADLVLNLAAGLDARPYRMDLPAALQWVEVDERARQDLFANLDARAASIVVASEGLLIYFSPEDVASLARDLSAKEHFRSWIIDLASPGQLRLMQRTTGKQLSEAGAAFKFGPREGAQFFAPYGWEPKDVRGLLKTAAQFQRAPQALLSLLPEPNGNPGNYPWTGVCLLDRR
jgi:O-methyltransferase involved in polyketide biosynthesis